MAWWNFWRNRPIGLQPVDDGFWQGYFGADNFADEPVDARAAMQLSAFWAATRLIAETIATLPIGLYERGSDGDKKPISGHDLYGILHDSPNADQTAVEFWEGRCLGLCTGGNGFAEKHMASSGRVISLDRMPADTGVHRNEAGALEYRFFDRGKEEKLPEEKVFHIRGFGDGDVGMSPVTYARNTLGITRAAERQTGQTFSKGMKTRGFFVMPSGSKPLTLEQRADAKRNLVEANTGPNAPWAGILEGGVDFKSVNLSPRDAEMILSRRFQVEDVCRWLRVPPVLIGHASEGQTMWGTGIEQIVLGWLTLGLRPYLTRIEQRIKKDLLTPADKARGIFAEFAVEGILRADSKGRAELMSKMMQNAGLRPNEWRRKENLPPDPNPLADSLFINSTLIPLSMAGQPRGGRQQPPAPPENQR
ncbi:phage portal protein [Sphingomonas histidinilytica]|uniref:phage portal protein n=1 Tax=Rhizorhabdus histidinilytica TaxID=439228 RepID=UPI001ADA415E|nr:phage portal protein [Rhizorhabdus histidinilytica]MBO9377684.1 phage portal protein [Rhizorhabdus histidinilytica]